VNRLNQPVEVVGITHAVAALDGSSLYQVAFGTIGKLRGPSANPSLPVNADVAAISMVVFVPADRSSPYTMGSKWVLSVDSKGAVKLTPARRTSRAREKQ
jgi:hypothetical protein